ncbi:hypothetical protein D9758_008344 [Tetrapyrgos nigripes]|uniref:Heterokaryon incompatibility domain-containing protein n=1 Tax=Tetrapyrgos nigripes TaxID=182062 RepID=A0A8H5LN15_9AGAR|nr:hypothetical protein D9758_008344 [Tetrapyrgos nigripes]
MRLLHTSRYELREFSGPDNAIPEYAILSHTWEDDEVLFSDFRCQSSLEKAKSEKTRSWHKLLKTCERAKYDGLEWVWIDTCCINKESSAELSEAINSMFRYYSDAFVCYAYLSDYLIREHDYPDVEHGNAAFSNCRWFTRGWTLQELIAPDQVVFFDAEWRDLGTKTGMKEAVSSVTGIPVQVFEDGSLLNTSIAAKMSWAAERQTTREEDCAYSLMGLFAVNMPPLYGEGGERAFMHLQEEIIKYSTDQSIFAWVQEDVPGTSTRHRGLLARSPSEFKASGHVRAMTIRSDFPYSLTNRGLHIYLPMTRVYDIITHDSDNVFVAYLNCTVVTARGVEHLGIYFRKLDGPERLYERWHPERLWATRPNIQGLKIKEIFVKEFHPYQGRQGLWSGDSKRLRNPAEILFTWKKSASSVCSDTLLELDSTGPGTTTAGRRYELCYRSNPDEESRPPQKLDLLFAHDWKGQLSLSLHHKEEGVWAWRILERMMDAYRLCPHSRDQVIMPLNEHESLLVQARKVQRPEHVKSDFPVGFRLEFSTCRREISSSSLHLRRPMITSFPPLYDKSMYSKYLSAAFKIAYYTLRK